MVIQHSDVTKTSGIEAIIKLKRNVQNVNGNDSLTFLKISKNKSPPLLSFSSLRTLVILD